MKKKFEFSINTNNAGKRIDIATSEASQLTRSQIQRCIEKGHLTVNDLHVRAKYRTKPGDLIRIAIPQESDDLTEENIPIEILYKDDVLIVVNKPPGLVMYPAAGHRSGTLMNAIAFHSKKRATIGGPLRPGVVHRLDKDTSGILTVAIDDRAYYSLVKQFKERAISRKYAVLTFGNLKEDRGTIARKIGRSESHRKKMSTKVRRGKEAVTRWKVIERLSNATLIEAELATGRTHQIRVHFASIGHPVLGDRTYGKKTSIGTGTKRITFPRQMLHAESLGFQHPLTGNYLEFKTELPDDMKMKIIELRDLQKDSR
jgi:23S rRNA pseudouridine1911/1915/1917 synthase